MIITQLCVSIRIVFQLDSLTHTNTFLLRLSPLIKKQFLNLQKRSRNSEEQYRQLTIDDVGIDEDNVITTITIIPPEEPSVTMCV